jgi:HlyD family secretion protein
MQVNFSWLAKYSKPSPRIVGLVLAGVIGIGGIVAIVSNRPRQGHLKAQTVPVKVEDLQVRISTSGSIVPVQEVNLSATVATTS